MPLILLDDVGAGGVGGDLGALGFGIGIEAIAPPILDLGLFFAFTLPDFSRVSNLCLNSSLYLCLYVYLSTCIKNRRKCDKFRFNLTTSVKTL